MLKVYLAGEIHTNWRDEIIESCKKQNLDIQFSSPVTDHASSDDCGVEILGPEEKNFWKRCLEELEQCPEDLDRAQSLIRQHSSLEDTMTRARHYAALARDSLDLFNDCEAKQALTSVIDFCIEREF